MKVNLIGQEVPAETQIRSNNYSARARKGWNTRRKMVKSAEELTHDDVLMAARVIKVSGGDPKAVATGYVGRKLAQKVRRIFSARRKLDANHQ